MVNKNTEQGTKHEKLYDTPVFLAIEAGNCDEVNSLIVGENGANVNVRGSFDNTPLHIAVSPLNNADVPLSRLKIITILLDYGADVHLKNNYGNTSLHYAALHGSIETVTTLLQHGANVNLKNNQGYTPLHMAVIYDCPKMIKLLIKHGARIDEENCVIQMAAKHTNPEVPQAMAEGLRVRVIEMLAIAALLGEQSLAIKDEHSIPPDITFSIKPVTLFPSPPLRGGEG